MCKNSHQSHSYYLAVMLLCVPQVSHPSSALVVLTAFSAHLNALALCLSRLYNSKTAPIRAACLPQKELTVAL